MTNLNRHSLALTLTLFLLFGGFIIQPEVKTIAGILLFGGAMAATYVLTLLIRIEIGYPDKERLANLKAYAADYGGFWSAAGFLLVLVITGKFP